MAVYWPWAVISLLLWRCVPWGKIFWNTEGEVGIFRWGVYDTWKLKRFGTYNLRRDLMNPGPACVWRSKLQRGQKMLGLLSNLHADRRLKRPGCKHSTWRTGHITTHDRHSVWITSACCCFEAGGVLLSVMLNPCFSKLSVYKGFSVKPLGLRIVKLWTHLLPNSTSWSSVRMSIMFGFLSLGISYGWTGIGCFFSFPPRRCIWNSVAAFDPGLWGANTSSTEVESSGRCWWRICGERFEEPTPTAMSQKRTAANNGVTSRAMLVGRSLFQRTDVSGIAVGSRATWKCRQKHCIRNNGILGHC